AGIHVQVVEDACAGVDEESHQRAIALMRLYAPMLEIVTVGHLRRLRDAAAKPDDANRSEPQ
ncbi:MAG TPA: hypothetical protein VGD34_02290, partial [Kribbella sp.]